MLRGRPPPEHAAWLQELLAIPGVGEVMEGLASYSQRHFARIDRLARSAFLLDYTLAAMKVRLSRTCAAA